MHGTLNQTPIVGSAVSLYSGAGGLDYGFLSAGIETTWANDIDPAAVETHNKLFGHDVARDGDIRTRKKELPRPGTADLVIGGPPCQGFSVAGKMDPNDPRSRHVWDFLGVVKHMRPRAFVMENVKALAMNRRWIALRDQLFSASVKMGYSTQILLLNASHFGVPQARERMFLIGLRNGHPPVVPITSTAQALPSVRSAIETLPPLGKPGNDSLCTAKVTPAKKPVLRRSPFAGMIFNGHGRPLDLERPALTLPASMGGNRTPIVDQHQLERRGESWVIDYHEHLWNGGDPVARVPDHLRRLTVEEAAAIQTFPRGMHLGGRQSAQYRQIGNAVPPKLAEQVAKAIVRSLSNVDVARDSAWSEQYELLNSRPS